MKIKGLLAVLFAVAMLVLYFLGNCEWDLWVLIAAFIIDVVFVLISMKQEDKLRRLQGRES